MNIHEVAVEYGRTVSDGNFGSERVGIILTATKDEGEPAAKVVEALAALARSLVAEQLHQAMTPGVRRAAEASLEVG